MELSKKALKDLKIALKKSYGPELESSLSNEEVNQIGNLLLTTFAEGLKMKVNEKINT